jgi:nicotinate-nucleotide pyrophosphorylase (carboxylating)
VTADSLIDAALIEDIGSGDHTSLATLDSAASGQAYMLVKEDGVIAGLHLAEQVFLKLDRDLRVDILKPDGSEVRSGELVMSISGKQVSILSAERTALNFVQRLSGVATLTHRFVKALEGTGAKLLDTRKTTPGWRALEKEAVRLGGGHNHRMGLYDMILIKDNHVDYCGGVGPAVERTRSYLQQHDLKLEIEVEVRNLSEVEAALKARPDRILLDNFSVPELRKAVARIADAAETEASGGILLDNIRAVAESGVDYISVGAITHSAPALNVSLEAA